MPRKTGYQLDYDKEYDGYDEYEDYDDDCVYEGKDHELVGSKHEIGPGVWNCTVCTYDNDESMPCCDICGVLRAPTFNIGDKLDKKTVDGMFPDSGVSRLAKSLFTSLPHQTPKKAVIFRHQNDNFVTGGYMCSEFGKIPGYSHECHNVLGSYNSHRADIVPFKFDIPSPDDLVSSRLSSLKNPRGSLPVEKNTSIRAQPNAKKSDHLSKVKEHDSMQKKSNAPSLKKGRSNIRDSNYDAEAPSSSTIQDGFPVLTAKVEPNITKGTSSQGTGHKPKSLTNSMENMTLNVKSELSKLSISAKSSTSQYKTEKWMLPDERVDRMAQLNLAIVGHVDSGKSTLSGRFLQLLGEISRKDMHKYEKEAKMQGKGSFAYAWALDESTEERERGITMTVAVAYFSTKKYHVVILDSPGHKDFVPNMISGATQADAAILVVDASLGSFEVGLDATGGQTREHAQLIRSFGVDQIIVAVNKMDAVQYSNERFELIKRQLGSFLHLCNFKDSLVSWVPLSAMENQNMVAAATDTRLKSWYDGPHLLEAIDSLHPPTREYMKPLLMPICDLVRTHSTGPVSVCGKLEAGALRSGCKVLVMPLGEIGTVRSIECNAKPCSVARAGDNIAVSIQGVDVGQVMAGGVLCHPYFPIRVAARLELKVLVLDLVTPILVGSQLEFHIHHAKEAAHIVKINSLLDPKTGKVTKKSPRCLLSRQNAVIEVGLQGAVCVDEFSNCKPLGRVFLRTSGRTVALGVVTQILD